MATPEQLADALRLFTENGYLDRLEVDALAELILADGQISDEERAFIEQVVETCRFEEDAATRLKGLLDGSRIRR